ncbi:MAG: TlpA family protein disulfide reductase [Chloroflexi bacterium]|nr:TlpA family protein disulfide reductase [Chloroflexota bacterium]
MPVWQQFYEKNQSKGIEVLSVALDLQGADKARPFAEKAKATYTTVVDEENLLGQLYGFKAVPNGFLIDEQGIVQYKKLGGFDIRKGEFADIVDKWVDSPGLDESLQAAETELSEGHSRAIDLFREGLKLYRQGSVDAAVVEWRRGVELEPDNWVIRKQIWAVQHPDRFYAADVDFDWQKEQIAQGL